MPEGQLNDRTGPWKAPMPEAPLGCIPYDRPSPFDLSPTSIHDSGFFASQPCCIDSRDPHAPQRNTRPYASLNFFAGYNAAENLEYGSGGETAQRFSHFASASLAASLPPLSCAASDERSEPSPPTQSELEEYPHWQQPHPSTLAAPLGSYSARLKEQLPHPYQPSWSHSPNIPYQYTAYVGQAEAYPITPASHLPPGDKPPPYRLEKPFQCVKCGSSFSRNHDLKRHSRIHLPVKPFPCSFCDKAFSRKDALKRHLVVKGCSKNKNISAPENVPNSDAQRAFQSHSVSPPGFSQTSTPCSSSTFTRDESVDHESGSPQARMAKCLLPQKKDSNTLSQIKLENITCSLPTFSQHKSHPQ